MFSFLRRKPRAQPPAEPPTFNERVTRFWQWFEDVAPRLTSVIDAGQSPTLAEETSARVSEISPRLAWVFGPGPDSKGHSLTVSGEGNEHLQLLAIQWLSQAPVIPGWTFYPSRQAGPIKGHVISLEGMRFDPKEIWITPDVNEEQKRVNLTVWHPSWVKLEANVRWTVVYLFLDEVLGEYGTQWWIGKIEFGADQLAGSFPLEELDSYVTGLTTAKGWKKSPPGETWTVLTVNVEEDKFPRADVRTQTTCALELFRDYMDADGEMKDPLDGSGADYVYVSLARSLFPRGAETDKRAEIEQAIERALEPVAGGRCLGGAMGTARGYVDFLIFDGARSLAIVEKALRDLKVPAGTMIEFFAREKRGRRIAL